jgi:fucose 4-O-acetylase-like acetyltransferase
MILIFLSIIAITATQILVNKIWSSNFLVSRFFNSKYEISPSKKFLYFTPIVLKSIILTSLIKYFQLSLFSGIFLILICLSFIFLHLLEDLNSTNHINNKNQVSLNIISFGRTFFSLLLSFLVGYVIL